MYKNITFSADGRLIELARKRAEKQKRPLNQIFRDWLQAFVSSDASSASYDTLMKKLDYAKPGRRFSRDEMNER